MITSHELRQKYLDFFASRNHAVIPSAPIVPDNDPTTLFTSSGMQPLVPFLLGEKHPEGTRLVNSQRCFRSVDMDEVGDNRHTTFFEMLGNWSLGDYFKKEQIPWFWEFLTKEIGLDPHRIYVSCFIGDEAAGIPKDIESAAIWTELFEKSDILAKQVDIGTEENGYSIGDQGGRIFFYGEKNWWCRAGKAKNMPEGEPGGPDTEMFYLFPTVAHNPKYGKQCHVNCDCGRYIELGNSVFMEYLKTSTGFEKLPKQNVDYGGGLERIAAAAIDSPDVFMIDVFEKPREILERVSGKRYGGQSEDTKAFRVIMDHLRAATFLIADGAGPSNKDQGYYTRRLMRRAIRYAHHLGLRSSFCADVASAIVTEYAPSFPYLGSKLEEIKLVMSNEEEKFGKTLAMGLKIFEEAIALLHSGSMLPVKETFDLYQSYGFPIEMTQELAAERGITIDREAFNEELRKHQELSRSGAELKFHGGLADHAVDTVRLHTANHMLLETMKRVLGRDVNQRGSNITSERLRLDFNYPAKLTPEQLQQIQDLTNEQLSQDLPVHYEVMSLEQARAEEATGVFEDRYSQNVKVYKMGIPGTYYSVEICGGPHVRHTAQVGKFKITKEEAVSAGVRRLKAVIEGGVEMNDGEQALEEYPNSAHAR